MEEINMEEIMNTLDFKFTKFEKLNKEVQKINEVTQKGKVRLQQPQGVEKSIVS